MIVFEMEERDLWPGLIRRWQGARYVHGNVIAPNLKTHSSSSKPIWQQQSKAAAKHSAKSAIRNMVTNNFEDKQLYILVSP